mgnify:CR=1 FL=1
MNEWMNEWWESFSSFIIFQSNHLIAVCVCVCLCLWVCKIVFQLNQQNFSWQNHWIKEFCLKRISLQVRERKKERERYEISKTNGIFIMFVFLPSSTLPSEKNWSIIWPDLKKTVDDVLIIQSFFSCCLLHSRSVCYSLLIFLVLPQIFIHSLMNELL